MIDTQTSDTIIVILTIIIALLVFLIVLINLEFYKEKRASKKKIKFLKATFVKTNKQKLKLLDKIKLSEEWKNNIATINTKLGLAIFDLNKELVKILSKNNLA